MKKNCLKVRAWVVFMNTITAKLTELWITLKRVWDTASLGPVGPVGPVNVTSKKALREKPSHANEPKANPPQSLKRVNSFIPKSTRKFLLNFS